MNNSYFINKRGSLLDPIFSGAYLLKVAVTILICLFVWGAFQVLMAQTIQGSHSEGILTEVMDTLTTAYFSIDYMFPFLVGGLLLVSTLFAFKAGANYIWAWFSIIAWGVALLLAGVFVNVYLTVSDKFPGIYAAMPVMDIIMSNLVWITLFWLAIITAVMFRKTNSEDDSSGGMNRRFYGTK